MNYSLCFISKYSSAYQPQMHCYSRHEWAVQHACCCPLRCYNADLSPLKTEETNIKQQWIKSFLTLLSYSKLPPLLHHKMCEMTVEVWSPSCGFLMKCRLTLSSELVIRRGNSFPSALAETSQWKFFKEIISETEGLEFRLASGLFIVVKAGFYNISITY